MNQATGSTEADALRSVIAASTAAVVLAACGATSPTAAHGGTLTSAHSAASDPGAPQRLVDEVHRELIAMRSSRYQHTTRVDENTGTTSTTVPASLITPRGE